MRETTASEIERISVIILLAGSAVSIIIMRDFKYFFSFAVASSIMILNFRYLRRIIEGFFGSAAAQTPAEEGQPGEKATKVSAISKGELLIRLPLKFAILIALIVVVLMWGHVNIPFFVIGLSTVFLSILISQVVVAFSPEAGRKHNGT
jgi:ATP synthase I chain